MHVDAIDRFTGGGLPSRRPFSLAGSATEHVFTGVSNDQYLRMLELASFKFCHSLGGSSLMTLPGVRDLTRQMLDEGRFDQVFFHSGLPGSVPCYADAVKRDVILDALNNYEQHRAWLRLTRIDEVKVCFAGIVEQFYRDLCDLYGRDIRQDVVKTFTTLFVSSPYAVTPYHIDHTWNFLLQIAGSKTVHLFDPGDPSVLTQQEKEAWYVQRGKIEQRANAQGIAYDLDPGEGVHHPVNAPHWVQNGPKVSISLSLGICLGDATRDAKVHQANYVLRQIGLRPMPPRWSGWRDNFKVSAVDLLADRNPNSFDDVLFSSVRRVKRWLKPLVHRKRARP